jgi:hypothetical protein
VVNPCSVAVLGVFGHLDRWFAGTPAGRVAECVRVVERELVGSTSAAELVPDRLTFSANVTLR